MSFLTKITRNVLRNNQVMRNTANANYKPGVNDDRIYKWLSTITNKATSPEAKGYCTQLSSLIHFYNKKADLTATKAIDWKSWKQEITTSGFVDKLETNFNNLLKEEYLVDKICKDVTSSQSKDFEELDKELSFHGAVWLNCYADYTMFLFELEEYGDPNDYLMHENYDFFYGLESELEELTETHNYIAGSKDDINLRGYMAFQFGWGKKVISFYRHPADDFKCGRCTKNILGR